MRNEALISELTNYLIDEHLTWSIEDCKPATLRDGIKCEFLIQTILDYMTGAGYDIKTSVS
jgi:hypothetical protein